MAGHARSDLLKLALGLAAAIFIVVPLAFLLGLAVQALWNWLLPGIVGVRTISYWEAWGLFILARLLFGGARLTLRGGDRRGGYRDKVRERFHAKESEPADGAAGS